MPKLLEFSRVLFRSKALRVNPDYAEAHCNLGHALREMGRFTEAVAALRQGHQLGSRRPRRPRWPYPSAGWVREAERSEGRRVGKRRRRRGGGGGER